MTTMTPVAPPPTVRADFLDGFAAMHAGLRRDAAALPAAIERAELTASLPALQAWFAHFSRTIERHHRREDEVVWPALVQVAPDFADDLIALEADHHELDEVLAATATALDDAASGHGIADATRCATRLSTLMDDHLDREEAAAFGRLSAAMTADEYAELERQIGEGTPLGDVAFELPWVLDGLDPTATQTVLHMVPAPVRLLHRVVLRRRYERVAAPIRAVRARDGAVSARQRRVMVGVNRAVNTVVIALRPRRFRGAPLLMLTTTGRRSGEPRTTPLIYLDDGDRWIVVASNGGSDWEPGWWLNLRAGSPASVRVGNRAVEVIGREVEEPERGAVWARLLEETFDFTAYQATVRRRLAVVALEPLPLG